MNPQAVAHGGKLPPFPGLCALLQFLALVWAVVNIPLMERRIYASESLRSWNPLGKAVVATLSATSYACLTLLGFAFVAMTHLV
jgi:hypothetical protein